MTRVMDRFRFAPVVSRKERTNTTGKHSDRFVEGSDMEIILLWQDCCYKWWMKKLIAVNTSLLHLVLGKSGVRRKT